MRSKRKILLNKIDKKVWRVFARCNDKKHLWEKSKFKDNLYTCKCCTAIKFTDECGGK